MTSATELKKMDSFPGESLNNVSAKLRSIASDMDELSGRLTSLISNLGLSGLTAKAADIAVANASRDIARGSQWISEIADAREYAVTGGENAKSSVDTLTAMIGNNMNENRLAELNDLPIPHDPVECAEHVLPFAQTENDNLRAHTEIAISMLPKLDAGANTPTGSGEGSQTLPHGADPILPHANGEAEPITPEFRGANTASATTSWIGPSAIPAPGTEAGSRESWALSTAGATTSDPTGFESAHHGLGSSFSENATATTTAGAVPAAAADISTFDTGGATVSGPSGATAAGASALALGGARMLQSKGALRAAASAITRGAVGSSSARAAAARSTTSGGGATARAAASAAAASRGTGGAATRGGSSASGTGTPPARGTGASARGTTASRGVAPARGAGGATARGASATGARGTTARGGTGSVTRGGMPARGAGTTGAQGASPAGARGASASRGLTTARGAGGRAGAANGGASTASRVTSRGGAGAPGGGRPLAVNSRGQKKDSQPENNESYSAQEIETDESVTFLEAGARE